MHPVYLLIAYCLLIFAMSLAGGLVPLKIRLTHKGLQIAMSFTGGLMLGVGLLHLLPHAFLAMGSIDLTVGCTMLGLLTMFSLIRIFRSHQHEPPEHVHTQCEHAEPHSHSHGEHHDHHDHDHGHDRQGHHAQPSSTMSWMGLFVGLSLHSLIDGVALASSVVVEADESVGVWGFGAFLAILLHKPLDAIPLTTVMSARGWSKRSIQLVNVVFALMCPLGALVFALGVHWIATDHQVLLGIALAFSAGVFLCISLSDLLPEVQFHTHDRFALTISLFAGVLVSYAITLVEPPHMHGHDHNDHHEEHVGETDE